MNVRVPHRLTRDLAAVHANVKAVRLERLLKHILYLADEIKGIRVLLGSHLPDGYNVSAWNNQSMTLGDGEAIEESE